jgi:predicted metal-binding membrane protein
MPPKLSLPLVAIAMTAPAALLVLYLWNTHPSGASPHELHQPAAVILGRLAVFLAAWLLMTAAMMLPSAMPLLVSLDRMTRSHAEGARAPAVAAIAYLGVWMVVGCAVWAGGAGAQTYLLPRVSEHAASWIAGGALILAGVYGLSPLASACLRACRRPFGFLARHWRGGSRASVQAARIGAAYGVSCVGCCVPMIGLMFVVGMANIALVIAMGVLMVAMKSSSVGTRVSQVLSMALIGAGVAMGFAWLPVPPGHH